MARNATHRRASVAILRQSTSYCPTSYCRVVPPNPLSPDQKFRRAFAQPRFFHRGIGYSSLSEASLAALCELLIPHFQIIEGVTYQIPLSCGASVDFLVNGVLVEYHEPRLKPDRGKHGDFHSLAEYHSYRKALKQCGRNQYRRESLLNLTRQRLTKLYTEKREKLVLSDPIYRQLELAVASSVSDFYEKIIRRFAAQPPSLDEFNSLFWWWVKIIAKENRRNSKRRLATDVPSS